LWISLMSVVLKSNSGLKCLTFSTAFKTLLVIQYLCRIIISIRNLKPLYRIFKIHIIFSLYYISSFPEYTHASFC
jgi:hypothetical protein